MNLQRNKATLVFAILSALLATWPLAGCRRAPSSAAAGPRAPCSVRTAPVPSRAASRQATLSGVTEPVRRATPAARVMARVTAAGFHEGDRVRAGRVLVQLDARDLQARRGQAQAAQGAAKVGLGVAKANLDRMKALNEQEAIPRTKLESMEVAYAQTNAAIASVDAAMDELDVNLSYASVPAPFDGVVVRRMTEVGNLVGPGQPLFVIEDDSQLRVVASAGAEIASNLTPGQTVQVELGDETVEGKIEAVVSSGDPRAPGLSVQVLLDNANRQRRAGMLAVVRVELPEPGANAVWLPRAALVERGKLTGVFVVADDHAARLRWLVVDDADAENVRVLSGLRGAERVILGPHAACVVDGAPLAEVGR